MTGMNGLRMRDLMRMAGTLLAALALASLLALVAAQSRCQQRDPLPDRHAHHMHGAHHGERLPPMRDDGQGHAQDCCGLLCTGTAQLVTPGPDLVRVSAPAFATVRLRLRPAPPTRVAGTPVLPVGARAPPVLV
jgi:hypothetical protein